MIVSEKSHEREIYLEQFKQWDSDVCATGSLKEAAAVIEALADLHIVIDLIVLDQEKGDLDQLRLVQTVREKFSSDDTKILAIGTKEFQTYCQTQYPNELHKLINKPCPPSKLDDVIGEILDERSKKDTQNKKNMANNTASEYGVDVLVAEDNEVNQIVFTEILDDMNIKFEIANNGEEAVELWKKHHPALILMDVSMPVMNGHEATREIRRLEQAGNKEPTPICAITAHALKGDKEDCFAAGMNDYLSKPISPDMLMDKISVMLPSDHHKSQHVSSTAAAWQEWLYFLQMSHLW